VRLFQRLPEEQAIDRCGGTGISEQLIVHAGAVRQSSGGGRDSVRARVIVPRRVRVRPSTQYGMSSGSAAVETAW